MKNRHAYLIMAHNDLDILKKMLRLLDDSRNDIYIHIDSKIKKINFKEYQNICNLSKVNFIKRMDCRWGDYSLIECELRLLEASIKEKYSYYHLISGVDLPIKSQNEIHKFFEDNKGKEFIHFCNKEDTNYARKKVQYYYFMTKYLRNSKKIPLYTQKIINKISINIQKMCGVNRIKDKEIGFGSQWFSITDNLARYIVNNEEWIYLNFKNTKCPDEIFLQTLIKNSEFENNIFGKNLQGDYISCLRYIDWIRGNPYTWKKEDFNELIKSEFMFARKFSSFEDEEIINMICNYLNDNNN